MYLKPITLGILDFKKCDLLKAKNLLGIDFGSSLTKVIFLHKENEIQLSDDKIDFITFTHALFDNNNFKEAIIWTKEKAYLPKDNSYTINITGNNASNVKDFVESLFVLKVECIDETLATIAGHRIALEKIELKNLRASPVDTVLVGEISSKFLEQYTKVFSSKFFKDSLESSSKIFPCLLNVYCSLTRIIYFDEDGRGQMLGCPLLGRLSYMGLAKCLLDTNDYDEIMTLASTGNRANVDSQVKDLLLDDINSPYGKLPPELPTFQFGKSMDFNKGLEDYKKEDVASSLISLYAKDMLTLSVHSCQMKNIRKVNYLLNVELKSRVIPSTKHWRIQEFMMERIFGKINMEGSLNVFLSGNIFRSNLFQKSIKQLLMIFPYDINLDILNGGYFGALGAMLCNNEDRELYCKD